MLDVQLGARLGRKDFKDAADAFDEWDKQFEVGINRLPNTLRRELSLTIDKVIQEMVSRHSSLGGKRRNTTSTRLKSRSGEGINSIIESKEMRGGNTIESVEGRVGGNFYMAVHEFGAVITPKTAKYLTIPQPAALDSNGVPKKQSARQWMNTFVAKTSKGNLGIFQERSGRPVLLYILKKRVEIPARLGMGNTIAAKGDIMVRNLMDKIDKTFVR